jgi:5'-nucleotidase
MVKGFDYNHLIKIGFLNEEINNNLKDYKKNFDILILNDSKMDYVTSLIKEII